MQTPKEYQRNLSEGIITGQMLVDCLHSSNKRAKNYRDKAREYKHAWGRHAYENFLSAKAKQEQYYLQKETMLSILQPSCIHKEFIGYERVRIYSYMKEYNRSRDLKDIVWENCYWDDDYENEIWFYDIEQKDKPKYHYYLYYSPGGGHTFHTPIDEKDVASYDLEVVEIDRLETQGNDVSVLISNQFVVKVVQLIESGNYTFVPIPED